MARRLALGLLALALGCSTDAAADREDSPGPAKPDVPAEGGDLTQKLQLDQRAFPLLIWAAYVTEQDYFDKARLAPRAQLRSAIEELGKHAPELFGEFDGDNLIVTARAQTRQFSLAGVEDTMAAAELLEQVLVFVQPALDVEGEPLHELEYAAINGFLAPLDPHTILLTPEQHTDLGIKTRGHFGGIGAEIESDDRRVVIVRVLPGSPAQQQGLQAGDVILHIAGRSTVNLSSSEAQELIRGPVGTKVELRVRRAGKTFTVELTRDTIAIESVTASMLPDGIGYVTISTFQKDTAEKLEQAVRGMVEAGQLNGLIIDLRGNFGGLLTQASGILDQMASEGEVVIVHSAQGRESEEATAPLVVPESTSVVVLVDESSASAAEIVGGSVKHLGRGVVLGRASFGKGTVQMLKPATPYGRELALKLTVAEYRVAGDRKIQGVGVVPDLELLPVRLSELRDVAAYYDEERFERDRERARTAHLPSAKYEEGADAFVGKPPPVLRYLDERGPGSGIDAHTPAPMRDPEVRLAREVALALAGQPGRQHMLASLSKLAGELAAREDGRLVQALAQRELEWSGQPGQAQDAELGVELSIEGPANIPAGEPFTVHVAVENRSAQPAQRVHAITDCDQDELDGIEVLIGRIEPGQTVRRQLRVHVMPWHTDFSDQLRVRVHAGEPEPEPDGEGEVSFHVVALERPRLAFDWWIVDDPGSVAASPARPPLVLAPGEPAFTVTGNGDGLLQPGEQVLLAFEVSNDGPGLARESRAVLRNLSGAQGLLEEGVVELGALGPGRTARGAFGITVAPGADPAQPLELDLAIGDAFVRESARQKMRLRIAPGRPAFARARETTRIKPDGARVYNGADASTPALAQLEPGTAVELEGRAGEWAAVSLGSGRRGWIPVDRLEPGKGRAAKLEPGGRIVDPPRVFLEPMSARASEDHVELRGRAEHARRVRDVVVSVKGAVNAKQERKVHYAANPHVQGAEARTMEFHTRVPLEKGSNRVVVIVRDGDKVESRRDVLIYRE